MDSLHSTEKEQEQSAIDAEDNLAAWLEGTNLDDHENEHRYCYSRSSRSASDAEIKMWHCSYCHNPSAVLRKCAGCGKARLDPHALVRSLSVELTVYHVDIVMDLARSCTGQSTRLHASWRRVRCPHEAEKY
jgi:hypothetical protein